MDCTQVFDLARDGLKQVWIMPLIGLLLVLFSIVCVVVMIRSARAWFAWLLLVFTAAFTVITTAIPLTTYMKYRRALSGGAYDRVEGRVEQFRPMPPGGHDLERFTVRGEEFAYTDYAASPFFHRTQSAGGPVHEGVYVRVSHVHGNIIRLEVCEPRQAPLLRDRHTEAP